MQADGFGAVRWKAELGVRRSNAARKVEVRIERIDAGCVGEFLRAVIVWVRLRSASLVLVSSLDGFVVCVGSLFAGRLALVGRTFDSAVCTRVARLAVADGCVCCF